MASDFTVVFRNRRHFGDHPGVYEKQDPNVEFVGHAKSFAFQTPGAKDGEAGVLMYQAYGISFRHNAITINGSELAGTLTPGVEREWQSHVLVVPPGVLDATGDNHLHIETRTRSGEAEGNLDDFLMANAVVFYKRA